MLGGDHTATGSVELHQLAVYLGAGYTQYPAPCSAMVPGTAAMHGSSAAHLSTHYVCVAR